jgi:hypothetical protein
LIAIVAAVGLRWAVRPLVQGQMKQRYAVGHVAIYISDLMREFQPCILSVHEFRDGGEEKSGFAVDRSDLKVRTVNKF